MLVTWFLVWVCRREKTGFQYTVSRLCFVGGHFLLMEILISLSSSSVQVTVSFSF